MDRPHFGQPHGTVAVAAFLKFPKLERVPIRLLGCAVFKRPVLNQFRVESSIRCVVQILKKNAKQIAADRLAQIGCLYRNRRRLRLYAKGDPGKQKANRCKDKLLLSGAVQLGHGT
jgi:hypothetical protein